MAKCTLGNPVFEQSGTSVFEEISRLANASGAINLGQGFPEGLEPPALIEAAATALRQGPHQYPPMMGLPSLRRAVAENAKRFAGLDLDWEREVLVTSGATEALADAFLALITPGDEVILIEPAYDAYATLVRRAGGVVVPLRLEAPHWDLSSDDLKRVVTPRTRLLVVNNPMNPIGKVFSSAEIAAIAEVADANDLLVVADEVYEHIVLGERSFTSLLAAPLLRERVVRIGSAGKTFSVTGWKVGYVSACEKLLRLVARAHQYVTFTTPPALQAAVAAGLAFDDNYFSDLQGVLRERRDLLLEGLRGAGFAVADVDATYFAVADISALAPDGDDLAFCRRLTVGAGVAAVPLSGFYGARDVRTHIRFCFAKPAPVLQTAIKRLGSWRAANAARLAS